MIDSEVQAAVTLAASDTNITAEECKHLEGIPDHIMLPELLFFRIKKKKNWKGKQEQLARVTWHAAFDAALEIVSREEYRNAKEEISNQKENSEKKEGVKILATHIKNTCEKCPLRQENQHILEEVKE